MLMMLMMMMRRGSGSRGRLAEGSARAAGRGARSRRQRRSSSRISGGGGGTESSDSGASSRGRRSCGRHGARSRGEGRSPKRVARSGGSGVGAGAGRLAPARAGRGRLARGWRSSIHHHSSHVLPSPAPCCSARGAKQARGALRGRAACWRVQRCGSRRWQRGSLAPTLAVTDLSGWRRALVSGQVLAKVAQHALCCRRRFGNSGSWRSSSGATGRRGRCPRGRRVHHGRPRKVATFNNERAARLAVG